MEPNKQELLDALIEFRDQFNEAYPTIGKRFDAKGLCRFNSKRILENDIGITLIKRLIIHTILHKIASNRLYIEFFINGHTPYPFWFPPIYSDSDYNTTILPRLNLLNYIIEGLTQNDPELIKIFL